MTDLPARLPFFADPVGHAVDAEQAEARAEQERDAALKEAARYLSPTNENIAQGYLVAAIRDMAQILVTSKDNAAEALKQLAAANAHCDIYRRERDSAEARAEQAERQRDEWQETVRVIQQPHWCQQAADLRAALIEALDEWQDASQYKGDYLRQKHGDEARIAELRALASLPVATLEDQR